MNPRVLLPALALLAGCAVEESDRWRYERVIWERDPAVRSASEAAGAHAERAARRELTLDDCYRMALYRSEALAIDGERLVRLQTLYEQARGAILPNVTFRGSYTRQDDSGVASQSRFTLKERTEYKFSLSQPIFDGLLAFYALRQASSLYSAAEHDLRHARLLLYGNVADAFYAILQAERELATVEDTLRLARERLAELEQRQKVGMSRRSEVLAQEAEVASTQARVDRLRGALVVAGETLLFLTGLDRRPALKDDLPEPEAPPPVETFIERAVARRPDVKSLRDQADAAHEGRGAARAGYLPTADLDANYYTHREGISEGVDWDVVLSFTIPIFEGAVTQARLREANSSIREAGLRLQERLRALRRDVTRAHSDVTSLRSELASLEKAVASAQENYDLVQAEYRGGIVTNIEVLTSLDTLQRTRLDRDRARYELKLAAVALAINSGALPGESP